MRMCVSVGQDEAPVRTAQELDELDQPSGGRINTNVGQGGAPVRAAQELDELDQPSKGKCNETET